MSEIVYDNDAKVIVIRDRAERKLYKEKHKHKCRLPKPESTGLGYGGIVMCPKCYRRWKIGYNYNEFDRSGWMIWKRRWLPFPR